MAGSISLLAVLLLAGRPAAADVVFTFSQTGRTPAGAVTASGCIALSDAAFASGINVSRNQSNALTDWNALGITALSFTVNGLSVMLANLIPRSSRIISRPGRSA